MCVLQDYGHMKGLQEYQQIAALTCFHGEEALYRHGFTINFDSKLSVALA